MTKNPFLNALAAFIYIVLIAVLVNYLSKHLPGPDSAIMPVAMLSLFTLSAAVMGYLFVWQPLELYLDGNKKGGVQLLLQTIGIFAVLTVIVFVVLLSRVFK